MSEILKEYNDTGNCVVDLPVLYKKWNKTFTLSKYHQEYTLLKTKGKNGGLKVKISEEQALEIINELELIKIQSDTFTNACSFRSRGDIKNDIDKLMENYTEKLQEATMIGNVIHSYRKALNN